MFVHFNMATFQDREWGDPTSPADLFRPTALDTDQWAAAAQSANMTWGCLTTRHYDGFCIWPTKSAAANVGQTLHSTDIVRAYVNSFRKAGLRVGLYYSILSQRDDIRHFNVTSVKVQLIGKLMFRALQVSAAPPETKAGESSQSMQKPKRTDTYHIRLDR
jgi:alpha-L-fucosidase